MRSFVLPQERSLFDRWLLRVVIGLACAHVALSAWGTYRRIWQVQRIEIFASSTVLSPADTVGYDVITSGETHNLIRLELVQGEQHETLLEQRAGVNRINTYDPRLFRYTPKIAITPELLATFQLGPAALRLTVFGGQKFLRTPAPRVREVQVRLRRDDAADVSSPLSHE
jgi:hypothetical protein